MRWFKRAIAVAVLSMSTALGGIGASYGQQVYQQIKTFDAARRPST